MLGFQFEADMTKDGATGFGGLPLCLELMHASGLYRSAGRTLRVCGEQGWLDERMLASALALNLAGGDCVDDLERLEDDGGFASLLAAGERRLLSRRERQAMGRRWRRERSCTVPSPSAMLSWLERFHSPEEEARRRAGSAFIPAPTEALKGLWRVNQELVGFIQKRRHVRTATLDMDATLIESHKRQALHSYKGCKAYQPLNCWWAEQELMLHSEFRDGNVPAGFEQLRVLRECLDKAAALGVERVSLRSDGAGCQRELPLHGGEGRDARLGVTDFAVATDAAGAFRAAAGEVREADWRPLTRRDGSGRETVSGQEWAEVCHVPKWAGHGRRLADCRFLAIREPLRELALGDEATLPFPVADFEARGRHKLFGVVTNLRDAGDEVIRWHRERCGRSEAVHGEPKSDLAGGWMPSGKFGANAAWWAIAVIAHNLNAAMKGLALGPGWAHRRMKALRFHLIALPGRVVRHARRQIVRLSAAEETLAWIQSAQRCIQALARASPG